LQDTTKLVIEPPIYLSVKQISLAETSEEMIQIKQKQDRIKKEWEVLEEIKNCVWS
jgi:large-conductance mechanosensitive channel